MSELARGVSDVTRETIRHHVYILQREGYADTDKINGKRHVMPAEGAKMCDLYAALRPETRREIIRTLYHEPGQSGKEIAEDVGVSEATVSHHLSWLDDHDLIKRDRSGETISNYLSERTSRWLKSDLIPEGWKERLN
jgi:predicted transcriptional regulator